MIKLRATGSVVPAPDLQNPLGNRDLKNTEMGSLIVLTRHRASSWPSACDAVIHSRILKRTPPRI